jgi:peroxiredoxin
LVAHISKIKLTAQFNPSVKRYDSLVQQKLMKRLFLLLLAVLPAAAFAQDPQIFTLKGKVGNLNPPSRAYLAYQLGANKFVDSANITNGSFVFTGRLLNPTNASLLLDHAGAGLARVDSTADVLNLYLEKGEITLSSPDSVKKAQITGSKINDDSKRLVAQLKPIMDRAQKLAEEKKSATLMQQNSAEFQNSIQRRFKQLQTEQEAAIKIFILSNPNSYLSLIALYQVGGPSPDPAELDTLFNSLSPEIKNTESAKVFKNNLEEIKHTGIGATAPDFTENDVNGAPVKLSSFKGKFVLLDFWASWCGPCREENPNVVKVYNKFKDKNFTILSVSLDKADAKNSWLAAIRNDGLTWTQVSDLKFWDNAAAQLYYITSIPSNFLIDPNGKIIARDLRGADLDAKLAELFPK